MKKRIAVVGAGIIFHSNYSFLSTHYNVIGIYDNNKEYDSVHKQKIYKLERIKEKEYECVYITTMKYAFEIKDQLLKLGVSESKIYPFIGNTKTFNHNHLRFVNDRICYDDGIIKFGIGRNEGVGGLKEIFIDNTYNIRLKQECVVIDVGMNVGCSVLYFASKGHVKKIYGFEPLDKTFDIASSNISINSKEIRDKIEISNIGLGAEEKDIRVLYNSNWLTRFSTIDNEDNNGDIIVHIKNASKIIDPIIQRHMGKKIILKVDCEGAEYDIFDDLYNAKVLSKVDVILMEFHKGYTQKLEKILFESGFISFAFGDEEGIGMLYAVSEKSLS